MAYLPPQIEAREQLLAPGNITADTYQLGAAMQVMIDRTPDGSPLPTIRGIPAKPYVFMGAQEEFFETIEPDNNHPPYHRFHRLILPGAVEYIHASPEADLYHAKEFGDLAWYSTTALSLYGIRLAGSLIAGITDVRITDLDAFAKQHSQERTDGAAWDHSGRLYINAATCFLSAFEDLLRNERSATPASRLFGLRRQLGQTAGEMFVSMSVVLQARLHTTLAEVLSDNNAKIERRIRENKIFAAGGDKR